MMLTNIPKNNFSSGQIDRDVKGRYDLPLYQNGFEISKNFFHTIKGDCYYRTGFEFLDEIGYAALYEFKFSQEQAYLLVFRTEYIEFWSYNSNGELVRVLNDNDEELTVSHSWGTEIFNLNMTQNCDVLYINHNGGHYPEYQLTRTASNAFTLSTTTYTNTGTASLSSTSETDNHGFPCTCAFYENRLNRCSSSKYPTYLYGSKGADYNNITVGTGTNDGYQFDLAEANSRALWLISGVNSLLVGTAEGILTVNGGSTTSAITPEDVTAKLSCRDGVSSVRPIHKDNYVFFVSSNRRQLFMFEYDVLLEQFKATNLSKGNYEITKGGIKKLANKSDRFGLIFALCGKRLLSICFSSDEAVNAWSEFTTDGEFIDICTVTRPDGNYDLFANIKRVINGVTRYYLERLTETVEFSRFEDFVSDTDGFNPKEKYETERNDRFAFYRKIAEELKQCNYLDSSIRYSGLNKTSISFNPETNILTLLETEYNPTIYDDEFSAGYEDQYPHWRPSNGIWTIKLNNEITGPNGAETDYVGVYSEQITLNNPITTGKNLYLIKSKKIFDGKYVSISNKTISGQTYKVLKFNSTSGIPKVLNGIYDADELIMPAGTSTPAVNTELHVLYHGVGYYIGKISAVNTTQKTITIKADTISASEYNFMGEIKEVDIQNKTLKIGYHKDAFKSSDVGKRIWYKTKTGREYGIFDITGFIDNYNLNVNPIVMPTSSTYDEWYLSSTHFSGLEHLEGETVSVVGDGGYIGDYVVEDGEIDISNANVNRVGTAVIGLKHKGVLKSPNLGLLLQGTQTFSENKNIYKIGLDMSFSAGGEVGTNLYDLDKVQEFNPQGLYDIPPLPMDSYKEISYSDSYNKDKNFYIVQNSPLPLHLTSIIPYVKHINKV